MLHYFKRTWFLPYSSHVLYIKYSNYIFPVINLAFIQCYINIYTFFCLALIFIYTYYPGAETLMSRHFKGSVSRSPNDGSNNFWQGSQSSSSTSSFGGNKLTQKMGGMPERLIWSYVIQLTAAIRMIHSQGLCCRTLDPSKVLLIGNSR